ncbi:MAG: 2,3-bisphosphoglycerate-independent phosphoglycerate mutase [Thermoplasmataceae archaeon]
MDAKKMVLVVLDGLGDRGNKVLGGKTALQAAYRPNMNRLASHGIIGLMHPVAPGVRCGSDTSHLSLLGYDPLKFYSGRGPFEAMGIGVQVMGGDLAFRANFSTVNDEGVVVDRRAGRISESTTQLAKDLSFKMDGYEFIVKDGVEHRGALVVRGPGLSDKITDSDPHDSGLKVRRIEPLDDDARATADILNRYLDRSREILKKHPFNQDRVARGKLPANALLIRGPGKAPILPSFKDLHGLKGACIAGIPMIRGICAMVGMDIINVKGATGRVDTDYVGKFRTLREIIPRYDFIILNVKAPDAAGHDGDAILKRDVIEKTDEAIAEIIDISDELVICITGDHSTPCTLKDHSGDPLPILFSFQNESRETRAQFDEVSCSKGPLRLTSNDVLRYMMQLANRAEKYGA